MSKHKIRENKICQNCGRFVDKNFCPNCGQENTEVRHSFIYLVKHFIADLLHYDSSLWSTAKLLLFSPAALSKEYLAGKRKKYVDPIKLYIFISFLAFFIPGILPSNHDDMGINIQMNDKAFNDSLDRVIDDSIDKQINKNKKQSIFRDIGDSIMYENKTYSATEFESLVNNNTISSIEYHAIKIANKNKNILTDKERQKKILEFIINNLTKVLFIYMPIFAFWLWLFNNKKKFLYFDSAIFTLHYFSFVLLALTLANIFSAIFEYFNLSDLWGTLLYLALFGYTVFYFFRAHRLFFDQKRWISRFKAFTLININWFIILIISILYVIIAITWV